MRSATSAPAPPRERTWTGWPTSGSSCPRSCTAWPARPCVLNPLRWYPMATCRRRLRSPSTRAITCGISCGWRGRYAAISPRPPCRSANSPAAIRVRRRVGRAAAGRLFAALRPTPRSHRMCSTPPRGDPLVPVGAGQPGLQPGLGTAGVVGRHPRDPDVTAIPDVLVMVDGPAVQRAPCAAARSTNSGCSRSVAIEGPTAVAPTVVAAPPPR